MSEIKESREVPVAALRFSCEAEFGDNGDNAKTAPIRMLARSGKPLDHWFWGKIVHDNAGMRMHKNRLPIDYCHNSDEVIGYLNNFNVENGDLVASGALTPFKADDRAAEVISKAKAGVPWEASIDWTGGNTRIEELEVGQVAEVNGAQVAGPMLIVREWNLRGVAVCPYGADMNTESQVFGDSAKKQLVTIERSNQMAEEETVEQIESVEAVEEVTPVETPESAPVVEGAVEEQTPVEPETAAAPAVEVEPDPRAAFVAELKRFTERFGEKGTAWFTEGKTFDEAMALYAESLEGEVKQLRSAAPNGESTVLSSTPEVGKSKTGLSDAIRIR